MRGSGERLHGMQEVSGSIPLFSTKKALYFVGSMVLFFLPKPIFEGCIASPAPFSGFCRRFRYNPQRLTLHRFPKTPRTPPTVERFLGVLHFMLFDDPASCSAAAYSHCFSTSFSLFRSSGLAMCSFMPVFLASCTSSAKAFAVMAMMGTLPRLPGRERIAAVAS